MTYPDVENSGSGSGNERSRLLGDDDSGSPDAKKQHSSKILRILDFVWGGIYAPNASTYEPIEALLNTEDPKERDQLTEQWRDNRLNELSFVGVVSALLAGVLTSTGSWPDILPGKGKSPWPVRTSWYCGIILSLFSILTAAQQTVRLYRLSSHRDGLRKIRKLLASSNSNRKAGRLRPTRGQIYTWQMPVTFLTTATLCMIIGMFLHVWSATRYLPKDDWWGPDSKVALTFTIVATVSIIIFCAGQATLYSPHQDEDTE